MAESGSLGTLTVDLIANTGSFEKGMDRAEKSISGQKKAIAALRAEFDPTLAAYDRLEKKQEQLTRLFKKGAIDDGEFKNLSAAIEQARQSVDKGTQSFAKNGQSAKQLANNLRGVSAQFTDIAVSLQSGQNPLTVFLQQGGQLKDMFGGIGPAAKALGGYVLGLVNPFTVAAAAAGALALAYYKGSEEADAFSEAIILNGNVAGVSTAELSEMAQAVGSVTGTTGEAAEVLALLAANGKIASDSFELISTAAVNMESTTGKAVADTVKEFAELAKEPVEASAKLNEQYNYLTASVYEQITALDEQGDHLGAAKVATEAYADALNDRAGKMVENLGYIERGWKAVKDASKEALDSAKNFGRESGTADLIRQTQIAISEAEAGRAPSIPGERGTASGPEGVQLLKDRLVFLNDQITAEKEIADLDAQDAERNQKAIEGQKLLSKEYDQTATIVEKLEKRMDALNKARDDGIAADAWSEESQNKFEKAADQIQQEIGKALEPKKAARGPSEKAYSEDAGMKMLDNLRQQYAALEQQNQIGEKLGAQAQALAKFQQEIADIKGKAILTADQKALLASEDLITAQLKRNAALEEQIDLQKENAKALADYEKLNESIAKQDNKALEVTRQRFEILDKARQAGISDADYSQTASGIISQSSDKAPGFSGPSAENAGFLGEFTKLDEAEQAQDEWYEKQLANLATFRAERADLNDEWDAQELALKQQHEAQMGKIETARQQVGLNALGDFFGQVAQLSTSENKKGRQLAKTAAIAQATINAYTAATGAYASASAIPVVGWVLGPVAAAAALAAGLANVSAIKGQAHDGIMSVPSSGTWNLEKGERVTTANTSAALDKTLADIQAGQRNGGSRSGDVNVNVMLPPNSSRREMKEAAAITARRVSTEVNSTARYE